MAEHNELGKYGEEVAAQLLMSKGYSIIARDWRYGRSKSDIDIIAKTPDQATIVFVEVKTRRPYTKVPAFYSIDRKKMYHICRAANWYIIWNHITEAIRFDAIFVYVDRTTRRTTTQHYENAFMPVSF